MLLSSDENYKAPKNDNSLKQNQVVSEAIIKVSFLASLILSFKKYYLYTHYREPGTTKCYGVVRVSRSMRAFDLHFQDDNREEYRS